jgi:hypothetical protein
VGGREEGYALELICFVTSENCLHRLPLKMGIPLPEEDMNLGFGEPKAGG